jgi:hypothetical protein
MPLCQDTRGPFLTSPLVENFALGVKLSPGGEVHPSILLKSRECSPLGVNEGVKIPPWGQISPLGANFMPGGEVLPLGPGVKLRMALWAVRNYLHP